MMKPMAPPLILMAIIFVLSSIPGQLESEELKFLTDIDPQLQNMLHVPLFGTLQILWLQALTKRGLSGWKNIVTCLAISLAYGCFDELHQMFVPGRYASLVDLLLNVTGIVIGTLVFMLWFANNNQKSNA